MKSSVKFSILLFTIIVNLAVAQPSQPVPYDLSDGAYKLMSWDSSAQVNPAGTYPPNMLFHQTSKPDPQLEDEMDADWKCPYNLDSRSRFEGLGENGIGIVNTGQTQEDSVCILPGYAGEIVLALRTKNHKNIIVSWKAGLVSLTGKSNRQYCIRFQYRLGNSSEFADITDSTGNPVEYNYSGYLNNYPHPPDEQLFSVILPGDAEDRILVQLRWKYYYKLTDSASGTRPKMKIDDIDVKGDIINSAEEKTKSGFQISSISPNPATTMIEINFAARKSGRVRIKVIDVVGIEVSKNDYIIAEPGYNKIKIDFSEIGIIPGIYSVCIESENEIISKQFLIIK